MQGGRSCPLSFCMLRTALFLFWLTVLAGSLALPQATTPVVTKKPPVASPKKTPAPASATAAAKKSTAPAPSNPAVHKTTVAAPTAGASKTGATSKTGKSVPKSVSKSTKSGKKAAPAPVRQRGPMAPTPERYRDIQTALAEKGYLHGEPTGVWDNDSMDAMRRFQTDQKQTPTGKITASALIGLGLGPRPQDSSPLVPNAVAPATPPTVQPPPAPDSAPPQL